MGHAVTLHRIPGTDVPGFAAPPKEPWPDVVQVDVPYRRAMGRLHALIRDQNLASHTSCLPQSHHAQFSPCTLQGPGERAEQGFSALTAQRGSGFVAMGGFYSTSFACLSQRPASRRSKHGASANPRRIFDAERVFCSLTLRDAAWALKEAWALSTWACAMT